MTQAVEINPATTDHAEAILALVREAYQRWVPVISREPLPMRVDYREALTRHQIDVLRFENDIIGLIETDLKDDHLWIENIAISPAHQGKGYGKLLLNHAEAKARKANRAALRLLTNGAFDSNIALYQKLGYGITASEPFMGGTTVYMEKQLHPASVDPAYPVEMQLRAYNARDIEAFMPWWAEDCQYYLFPNTLVASGHEDIRVRHIERFKDENLFGRLLSRTVVGDVVVDNETVTRTFPEGIGRVDVICIYEVEGGKIKTARFKIGEPHFEGE